ncbi:MAG: hypothetical protein ACM31D_02915 [Bacteroidota bacterium]
MIARLVLLALTAGGMASFGLGIAALPSLLFAFDGGDNNQMLASVAWIGGGPLLIAGLQVAAWKTFMHGHKLTSLLLAAASTYNLIFLAAIFV